MAAKKPLPKRSKKVDSIDLYELVLQGMQSIDPVDRDAADSLRSLLVLQLKSPKVVIPPEAIKYYKLLLKLNASL
jgi:hypothetical protein